MTIGRKEKRTRGQALRERESRGGHQRPTRPSGQVAWKFLTRWRVHTRTGTGTGMGEWVGGGVYAKLCKEIAVPPIRIARRMLAS